MSVHDTQLLALLLADPRLHASIQREGGLDNARHCYLDTRFAEAALRAGWERPAIEATLNTAHQRVLRPVLPDAYVTLLLHEAALHLQTGDLGMARDALLAYVSHAWHLDILAVIRHGTENSRWSIRLVDGTEVALGTSAALGSQTAVRDAIFDRTGQRIPKMTGSGEWDHCLEMLAAVATTVVTPELTNRGTILDLLRHYLEGEHCVLTHDTSDEELYSLTLARRPFVQDGALYVNAPHIQAAIRYDMPELTRHVLLELLRQLGGVALTQYCQRGDEPRTSRTYWRIAPLSRLSEEGMAPPRA